VLSIHQRPFKPSDRGQAGHWEGDLIVGNNHLSAIGTLVERQTRLIRLLHLPARDAGSLHIAITTVFRDLPPSLVRSITWDQGIEMARRVDITADLGAPVYSATLTHLGSAEATRTATVCYASTSPRAPT
jgi:IS30 family transposase